MCRFNLLHLWNEHFSLKDDDFVIVHLAMLSQSNQINPPLVFVITMIHLSILATSDVLGIHSSLLPLLPN